jgi:hypothetical protein
MVAGQTEEPAWEVTFAGDVVPDKATPAWSGAPEPNTSATVTDKELVISDAGSAKGELIFFTRGWSVEPEFGATVEVALQVRACSGVAGVALLVADGVHEECLTFFPDRVFSHKSDLSITMDTTDRVHVYRVGIAGETVRLWIDGALAYDGKGKFTSPAHDGRNVVGFGSISSAATGEAAWRSVKYAVSRPLTTPGIDAEHVLIYKKEGVYACFPSLVNYGEGRLATSFGTRVRRSHIDGTGGGAQMMSEDAGATWNPQDAAPPNPLYLAADGSYVRAYARGWQEAPADQRAELEARGLEVRDVRDGIVAYCEGAYASRSTDGGKTWETTPIETPKLALLMCYNVSAERRTSHGVRLVAVYGRTASGARRTAWVLRSADDGKSWQFVTMAEPNDRYGYSETALGEALDGTIVAMLRTEPDECGYLHVSRSTDGGLTWSAPLNTGIWGHPANLLTLPDGRILCTYGYRRGAMGVRACLSADNGVTWDTDHTILLRTDGVGSGSDLGYPISTLLPDGRVLTIYYITLADQVTSIACTRWRVPPK